MVPTRRSNIFDDDFTAHDELTCTRIVWEVKGQEPVFGGQTYTLSPFSQPGVYSIEAEVQWPDGRRAFARNALSISGNAPTPPQLTSPQMLSGSGLPFVLAGAPPATYVIQASPDLIAWTPLATNTLPASGEVTVIDPQAALLSQRYYHAVQSP